jgi:radical SAM/SPASM domain protein of ACGX system
MEATVTKPVLSLQWHLTTRCEQRCQHCYLFNSPDAKVEINGERRMSHAKLVAIADGLVATCQRIGAAPRVSLTGGNPILHPGFWDILSHLRSNGVPVSLMGNPFGMSDQLAQRLHSMGIRKFQLSLDGLEATHDRFRKPGSFRATGEACRVLQRNGIGVAIMSTVSKENANDLPALVDHVVALGVRAYAFARHCPSDGDAGAGFTPAEYREFLGRMWEAFCRHEDSGTEFVLKDHLWNLFLMERGMFVPEDTGGVVVDGCGLGISHMTLLADGTVYACRRFKSPIGRVPEQSLLDIFFGAELDRYRDFNRLEKCRDCELLNYCRGCMAVSHSTTGRWEAADPQCWK